MVLFRDVGVPESGRREKARAKYKDLNPQVRHSGLLRILQSDQDGMIWRAVNLLLNEDNDKFLPFVLPLFESSNPNVRYATAFAFASWGFSGAIEPLKKLARHDPCSKARSTALAAIGKCGTAKELDFLREFFDSTDDDGNGWPLAQAARKAAEDLENRLNKISQQER